MTNKISRTKRWVCALLCACLSLSCSGCFFKTLIARPTEQLIQSITYDTVLDIMNRDDWMDTEHLATLKITFKTDSSVLTVSDSSALNIYTRTISSMLAENIADRSILSSLPEKATAINTYTLWKTYDSTLSDDEQPLICRGTLYRKDRRSIFALEFNDERIEEHCYYIPLKDSDVTYLSRLAEGLTKTSDR